MDTFYLICAVVGGTLFLGQFMLSVLGAGHEHDFGGHDGDMHDGGHEHEMSWFVGIITFRTMVAAVTAFGLAGLAAQGSGFSLGFGLGIALATGLAALWLVAMVMRVLMRLKADGSLVVANAVGLRGTVYLSIPGKNAGSGKVTVTLQNRSVEFEAVTMEEPLATGATVMVVDVVGSNKVQVVGAPLIGSSDNV